MDTNYMLEFAKNHNGEDSCIVHVEIVEGAAEVASTGGVTAILYSILLLIENLETEKVSFRKIIRELNRLHKQHEEVKLLSEFVNDAEEINDAT